jgi:hypothetical protein
VGILGERKKNKKRNEKVRKEETCIGKKKEKRMKKGNRMKE